MPHKFGVGGGLTTTVIVTVPVRPAVSVALAVIVWVPLLRVLEKLPPVPIWPSMLEVQTSLAVISPSRESRAEPVKLTGVP